MTGCTHPEVLLDDHPITRESIVWSRSKVRNRVYEVPQLAHFSSHTVAGSWISGTTVGLRCIDVVASMAYKSIPFLTVSYKSAAKISNMQVRTHGSLQDNAYPFRLVYPLRLVYPRRLVYQFRLMYLSRALFFEHSFPTTCIPLNVTWLRTCDSTPSSWLALNTTQSIAKHEQAVGEIEGQTLLFLEWYRRPFLSAHSIFWASLSCDGTFPGRGLGIFLADTRMAKDNHLRKIWRLACIVYPQFPSRRHLRWRCLY